MFVTESLTELTRDMGAACQTISSRRTSWRGHIHFRISDFTTQWDLVDDGKIKNLAETLQPEAKEDLVYDGGSSWTTEAESRLQRVTDIFEDSFKKFKDSFDVHPANHAHQALESHRPNAGSDAAA